MMEDPIVDEVHRASEILIKRYGGVHDWIKHLQAMDRARLRKAKAQRRKRAKNRSHTNSTAASRPTRKKFRRVTSRRTSRATV